jgi:hypothetical protein
MDAGGSKAGEVSSSGGATYCRTICERSGWKMTYAPLLLPRPQ